MASFHRLLSFLFCGLSGQNKLSLDAHTSRNGSELRERETTL